MFTSYLIIMIFNPLSKLDFKGIIDILFVNFKRMQRDSVSLNNLLILKFCACVRACVRVYVYKLLSSYLFSTKLNRSCACVLSDPICRLRKYRVQIKKVVFFSCFTCLTLMSMNIKILYLK